MAKIYWRTIKRGTRTLADVPETLREEVIAVAKSEVINNIITTEEYKKFIGEEYVA